MNENIKLRRRKDLTGNRFGRLIVLGAGLRKSKSRAMYWLCKCDCGVNKEIAAQVLVRGVTISCGCYNRDINSNRIIHGHEKEGNKTPTYVTWDKMMYRCHNENSREYSMYGGRGIVVCEEWKNFSNFVRDMGERPDGKTIDRIDFNLGYYKENCRWATTKQQGNNTRRNVFFEFNGEKKTISELADIAGINYDAMYYRLVAYKWSVDDAVMIRPSRKNSKKGYGFFKPKYEYKKEHNTSLGITPNYQSK